MCSGFSYSGSALLNHSWQFHMREIPELKPRLAAYKTSSDTPSLLFLWDPSPTQNHRESGCLYSGTWFCLGATPKSSELTLSSAQHHFMGLETMCGARGGISADHMQSKRPPCYSRGPALPFSVASMLTSFPSLPSRPKQQQPTGFGSPHPHPDQRR